MFLKQEFNLIVTIVDMGFDDLVITAAKNAGAEGATIITARGAGIHETDTFMGVAILPEKEMVLVLVKKSSRKKIMREICKSCGLNDEGKGMCFSLPVDEIGGITHLMNLSLKKGKSFIKQDKNKEKTDKKTVETSAKSNEKEEKQTSTQDKTVSSEKVKNEPVKETKTNETTKQDTKENNEDLKIDKK